MALMVAKAMHCVRCGAVYCAIRAVCEKFWQSDALFLDVTEFCTGPNAGLAKAKSVKYMGAALHATVECLTPQGGRTTTLLAHVRDTSSKLGLTRLPKARSRS